MADVGDDAMSEWGDGSPVPITSTAVLGHEGLDLLQRLVLTTDGTVVRLLEACLGEPIGLASHTQFTTPASSADGDLELSGGEDVLRRTVVLRGSETGRDYVYAESSIVLDRLDPDVRHALLATSEPIGEVLGGNRVETLRELLRTGRKPAGPVAQYFGIEESDEVLFRTYRIVSRGKPVMVITEHIRARPFPG